MISLIKNEYIKIFHKKGIYILALILVGYAFLTNYIYSNVDFYHNDYYSYDGDSKETLDKITPETDPDYYIHVKTSYQMELLSKTYDNGSWQQNMIHNYLYTIIYEINYNTYAKDKNDEIRIQREKEYEEMISHFDNNDWKYFSNFQIENTKKSLAEIEDELAKTTKKSKIAELQKQILTYKNTIELLNLRVDKNIDYSDSYLNRALVDYEDAYNSSVYFDNNNNDYASKLNYNDLLERMNINKYIVENEVDHYDTATTRYVISNIFSEYSIFILIMVLMIAGTIVSEEFSKGTVKLLLVRPYSRAKILLAKYITALSIIPIAVMLTLIIQLVIGGIFFGYSSISIPMLVYNFNTSSVVAYNIFHYILIITLANLPLFILITTFAFAISAIFTNSALAITLSLLGYFASMIINQLAIGFNVEFLKYFVTPNWDFTQYLFGHLPQFEYVNFNFSVVICIIYFLLLIVPSFIIFKKKNIKNI